MKRAKELKRKAKRDAKLSRKHARAAEAQATEPTTADPDQGAPGPDQETPQDPA